MGAPTKVPGQKPVTVGHQYSTLVYLPERSGPSDHWVVALSTLRVRSQESGTLLGMEQIKQVVKGTHFQDQLCLLVVDSAYSNPKCAMHVNDLNHLVVAARIRNNRIFHCKPIEPSGERNRGRPKIYGEKWPLSTPGDADEQTVIDYVTASGKQCKIKIERWYDRLDHAESKESDKSKVVPVVFDAVRATILKPDGQPIYKKPLWIMVTGKRRREISAEDIASSYLQRYDIEHYFRFAKQKLLLTSFQTPDVRHEEN